jgi:hypothetical protein
MCILTATCEFQTTAVCALGAEFFPEAATYEFQTENLGATYEFQTTTLDAS